MLPDPTTPAPDAIAGDRDLLAAPARQSPLAFVFIAGRFVRRLGLSALAAAFVFVFNGGLAIGAWLLVAVAAVALLVSSTLSWWRFTFAVADDELVVTRGVVSVERLVIPLDRVQTVSIDQRLFHRPFGLVRVAVDTAGTDESELEIDALDHRRATALRRVAADARGEGKAPTPGVGRSPAEPAGRDGDRDDEVVVRRSPGELVVIGATKMPLAGLAVLASFAAFGDELGILSGLTGRLERTADQLGDVADDSATALVAVVAGVVAVAALVAIVLQIAREVVTNWSLTLHRTPTGLRRTAGLFSTTSRSTTVRRVQILTTDDSWLQRRLGFTKLTLRIFGRDLDIPGTTPAELDRVRAIALGPGRRPAPGRWISGWSVFVAVRAWAVLAIGVAAVCWFAVGWWSLVAIAAVPLTIPTSVMRWRRRRWDLDREALVERTGLVRVHTGELPVHKAQVVTVTQSLFQRRRGLATIGVSTGGGSVSVPFVDLATAEAARDLVLHRAEHDRRRVI